MDLYEHFNRITRALDKKGVEFRVVGGIALAFYTRPRTTVDVDLFVRQEEVERVVRVLGTLGYEQLSPAMSLARGRIRITRLVYFKKREYFVVDLLWSDAKPISRIWSRRRNFKYEGRTIRVMDPAGLVILKKLRASPQDLVDIETLKRVIRRGKKKKTKR